jgi:hypothetical protein
VSSVFHNPGHRTVCVTPVEVLAESFPLPWYAAVIVWLARDNELVDKLAAPFDSETVPIVLEPSLNTTLPVGVPAPGANALTVALKVTAWPKFEGFGVAVSTDDVDAACTTWVKEGEVLAPKLLSSLYVTMIE